MALEEKQIWELINGVRGSYDLVRIRELMIAYIYIKMFGTLENQDQELLDQAKDILNASDKKLVDKFETLNRFDEADLKELVKLLVNMGSAIGMKDSSISSSREMARLAAELLEIEDNDKVFDLGCGYGSFLVNVFSYCDSKKIKLDTLAGLDINLVNLNSAKMALSLLTDVKLDITQKDLLKCDDLVNYTKGYVYPPFSLRFAGGNMKQPQSKVVDYMFELRSLTEWLFVDYMLASLSDGNKFVAVLRPTNLYNEIDREYREKIIKAGFVESIVELPQGSLEGTNIKCCLVVFSKGNKLINFVDASDVVTDPFEIRRSGLPVDKILDLYKNNGTYKSCEDVAAYNNILPSTVLALESVSTNGEELSKLADIIVGSQYTISKFKDILTNEKTGYRILTSSDIEDGLVDWNNLQAIDYKDNKLDKFAVKKGDLIMTSKSSKFKTVVVDIEPEEKIIVTGAMFIIRPKEDKLNSTFLKLYLDSEEGKNIIKSIQKGVTIMTIHTKDLESLIVPSVDIDKQNKMARKYNNKLFAIVALKSQLAELEKELDNFYLEEKDGE